MTTPARTTYNEKEKVWHGNKIESKFGNQHSIGAIVFKALQKQSDHISQISYTTGKKLTNREILLLSIRIAQHLEQLNIQQCEMVGICAANSDYLAPLFFACQYRGLIVSTLDPSFDKDDIKHIYSITKPKLMFCDGSIYHQVRMAFDECGLVSTTMYTIKDHIDGVPKLDDLMEETQREHEFKCVEDLKMGSNQVAAIFCSSGTTGLPKGVCVSHAAILNSLSFAPVSPQRILCFSTLYWVSGVLSLLSSTVVDKHTRFISENPFNPSDCLNIIKRYQITMFSGPPSQVQMLFSYSKLQKTDLNSLKIFFMGGSAVPQKLVGEIKSYLPGASIFSGYGLTEIAGTISTGLLNEDGNCGQLSNNFEVKVIDNCNQNLGPCEIGEICVKTLYPWAGYYGDPEATAETYDSERWIHSGDLGYVDDKGDIFIVDRKKDILQYNNFQFYPTEIENAILELPDVLEVCVCGIPDEVFTNLPAAAIVKAPGSILTENMVYQHVADRMVHFKHLRGGVYFFDKLSKTASGKIIRFKVAELCQKVYNKDIDK